MASTPKKPVPTELIEQYHFCQWLTWKRIPFFAVPNETKLIPFLTRKQRIKFFTDRQREGVKKGVQDLIVLLPTKILFIEMKRTKGSRTSNEQQHWKDLINSFPYAEATIAKGAQDAIRFTEKHQHI